MITRLGLAVLGLLCAVSTSAAVVNIQYIAHITEASGDGLGYRAGDLLSGNFIIDTSKSDGTVVSSPTDNWIYGSTAGGLVQTAYASNQVGPYVDYLSWSNDGFYMEDQIEFTKVLSWRGPLLDVLSVKVYFPGLNWIPDMSLNGINVAISDTNSLTQSNGVFGRFDMDALSATDDFARFSFDSLNIVSTKAPESTPIILFIIGAIGLVVRRRMM